MKVYQLRLRKNLSSSSEEQTVLIEANDEQEAVRKALKIDSWASVTVLSENPCFRPLGEETGRIVELMNELKTEAARLQGLGIKTFAHIQEGSAVPIIGAQLTARRKEEVTVS